MARVRQKNTNIEMAVCSILRSRGARFRRNVKTLPGSPDFVFSGSKLAVFVDGDFWHGWRFPCWSHKLSPFWKAKIARNRRRDRRNFATLRRRGWKVLRLWGHDVNRDAESATNRIIGMCDLTPRRARSYE
jgi:DNA mismatch endonuclease (patch repair protein)